MTLARRIFAEKRQIIYPLISALILNLAVFAAVVYPLSRKVAGGQQEARNAAQALAAARTDYEAANATVKGKTSADAELKKFYGAVLPPDQSEARRITYGKIDKLAAAANVQAGQQVYDVKQERDSDLAKWTATVVLTGEYRNIRRLIYELETAPEFLILENVALSQGQERERGLNVVVKVATYFRAGGDGN